MRIALARRRPFSITERKQKSYWGICQIIRHGKFFLTGWRQMFTLCIRGKPALFARKPLEFPGKKRATMLALLHQENSGIGSSPSVEAQRSGPLGFAVQ